MMRPAAGAGGMEAATLLEAGRWRARSQALRGGIEEEGYCRRQACAVR